MLSEDGSDTTRSGESDSHNFQFYHMLLRSRIHHNNGDHFVNTKGQRQQSQVSKVTAHKAFLGKRRSRRRYGPRKWVPCSKASPERDQGGHASHIYAFKDKKGACAMSFGLVISLQRRSPQGGSAMNTTALQPLRQAMKEDDPVGFRKSARSP